MIKKLFVLFLICNIALIINLDAKVILHSLISDNMVLQQQATIHLWGISSPNKQVIISPSWKSTEYTCLSDENGNWSLHILTPSASYTPYNIVFDDGEQTIVRNVLVGEVWVASGQSNMEMQLKGFPGGYIKNAVEEIMNASSYPHIRMFNVAHQQAYEPKDNCDGEWLEASVNTVTEFSATAWFFTKFLSQVLEVPVGIINSSYGGSTVEGWLSREILENYSNISLNKADIERTDPWMRPMVIYNAMLKPLQKYTIKGFIWYQGCNNVGTHLTYTDRLVDMVNLWRQGWGLGDVPFYIVEIAPLSYEDTYGSDFKGKAAFLREAQLNAQKQIPNSGFVCTNDLVEMHERLNAHPCDKRSVGLRLSLLALNQTYGLKQLPCFSPQFKSWHSQGKEAWISFDYLEKGFGRLCDITGFELAGKDRKFYPADKIWINNATNELVVSSKRVKNPISVRYCFKDFQIGNLIGANELPVIPFRTDDWDE